MVSRDRNPGFRSAESRFPLHRTQGVIRAGIFTTKTSDELLAHEYSKLYNIPYIGLSFFTVYGLASRPDKFYFSAAKKLAFRQKIQIFNYGDMKSYFTCIDDIVEGIVRVMQGSPPKASDPEGFPIPSYAVYNIGGGQPENLLDYIHLS